MSSIEELTSKRTQLRNELKDIKNTLNTNAQEILEHIKDCLNKGDYGVYIEKDFPGVTIYIFVDNNACKLSLDQWENVCLDGIAFVVYVSSEDRRCHRIETNKKITDWKALSVYKCKQALDSSAFQSWSAADVKKLLTICFSQLMEERIEKSLSNLEQSTGLHLGLPQFELLGE